MTYTDVVIKKFKAIFGEEALEPRIASFIISYVAYHQTAVRHLNLASVKQICSLPNNDRSDVVILKTLQALAGDAIGYLKVGFEYVDKNEEIHNIGQAEFLDAINEGVDPISGEKSSDLAERVLIFYYPDKTFPARLLHQ
jgi:hypothetical protein